jgi:hypothetical protein
MRFSAFVSGPIAGPSEAEIAAALSSAAGPRYRVPQERRRAGEGRRDGQPRAQQLYNCRRERSEAAEYGRNEKLRPSRERAAGLGLVVTDEAHKSRDDSVVLRSPEARRLALTATPVELNVDQKYPWSHWI